MVVTHYSWWALVEDLNKTIESLAEQYDPKKQPKYMKPGFDFYSSNWIKFNDWQAIQELQNRLRNYITGIMRFFEDNVFKVFIQHIKDYDMIGIERLKKLKDNWLEFMTNEMQPIVRTFVDRLHNNAIDSSVNTKVYPLDEMEQEDVKRIQKFIDTCFSSSWAKKTIKDSGFDGILHWVWYWRSRFRPLNKYFEDLAEDEKAWDKEYKIEEPHAVMDYVPRYCIFADPTKDFYENPLVYRNWFSIKNALKKLKDFVNLNQDQLTIILTQPQRFSDADFSKSKLMQWYDHCELDLTKYKESDIYSVRKDNDDVEYTEYWDWENLVIMLNGYIVFDWKNPLWNTHPFKYVSSWKMSDVWLKSGIGHTLSWIQKMYNTYYNIVFDLAKFTAWPMWYIEGNLQIEWLRNDNRLDWKPFDIKKVFWDWQIKMFPMPKPDEVNFKMLNEMLDMANFVVDPAAYNQIKSQSRSAADSHYRYEELKNSVKSLMESFNEAMVRTIKDWFRLAKKNLPPKIKFPIKTDTDKNVEWETLDIARLETNMLFETEFNSIANINRILERSQLMEFVQNSRILAEDPITQKYLLNNVKIINIMSELYNRPWEFWINDEQYKELVVKWEKLKKAISDNLKELGLSQQEEWMWWDMWQPEIPQQWASDVWQTIQTNPEQNIVDQPSIESFL